MKLRCVNNTNMIAFLTLGRIYEGEEAKMIDGGDAYKVKIDGGREVLFYRSRFEVIHEQAEVVIAHPYTVLTWTKDRGFQPCGAVFKTAEAVHDWIIGLSDPGAQVAYVHTPFGCLYTPNAIKTLGLNLWKEVNKE